MHGSRNGGTGGDCDRRKPRNRSSRGGAPMPRGRNVTLCARNRDSLAEARRGLEALGAGRVLSVEADLTEPSAAARVVEAAAATWGRIDILVNNAGAARGCPVRRTHGRALAGQSPTQALRIPPHGPAGPPASAAQRVGAHREHRRLGRSPAQPAVHAARPEQRRDPERHEGAGGCGGVAQHPGDDRLPGTDPDGAANPAACRMPRRKKGSRSRRPSAKPPAPFPCGAWAGRRRWRTWSRSSRRNARATSPAAS